MTTQNTPGVSMKGGLLVDSRQTSAAVKIDWQYLLMLYLAVLLLVPVEFYRINTGLPIDIQLDRIVAFTILLLWFVASLVDPRTKFYSSSTSYAILAFVGIVLLSFVLNMQQLTASIRYAEAIKRLLYIVAAALLFFFTSSTIRSRKQIDAVLRFSISIIVIISLLCMVEFLSGFNIFRHLHEVFPFLNPSTGKIAKVMHRGGHVRVAGSADHPIAMGVLLALFIPFALHYFEFAKEQSEKIKYGFSLAIISLASFMTISRTPVIAIMAMVGVYYFFKPARAIKLGVAILLVAFIVHMAFPGVLGGLKTFLSPSYLNKHEVQNNHGRYADYPRILSLFTEKPLYGRGYGWWNNDTMFYTDNQYLRVIVELGIAGLIALFWLFYKPIKEMWSAAIHAEPRDKDLLVSIIASCFAYIATSATYDSFGYAQVTFLFFILVALGTSLARHVQSEQFASTAVGGRSD